MCLTPLPQPPLCRSVAPLNSFSGWPHSWSCPFLRSILNCLHSGPAEQLMSCDLSSLSSWRCPSSLLRGISCSLDPTPLFFLRKRTVVVTFVALCMSENKFISSLTLIDSAGNGILLGAILPQDFEGIAPEPGVLCGFHFPCSLRIWMLECPQVILQFFLTSLLYIVVFKDFWAVLSMWCPKPFID